MIELTPSSLRAHGFTCRRETISGRGWLGGDGCVAYVVRAPSGELIDNASTCRSARRAWERAIATMRFRRDKAKWES